MMKCPSSIAGLLLTGFVLAFVPLATARPVQLWSIHELKEKADVVLIGIVSATGDAKGFTYEDAEADAWVKVDTVFQVETVFKGKLDAETVTVRHERYFDSEAEIEVIDGPNFIAFDVKQKQRYLMFLKRAEDGTLEPLSGRYNPEFSFLPISEVR